ncbi:putative O-methyltransferase [Glonium stellatum]|uniref:Putative O-methyltransferase n=1 Tax=Glonium stellatum TaxID=574774 RepID=A0A8E2JRN6_9PEZI|nr:putative O-methyltransferase [Glonium stellatum]
MRPPVKTKDLQGLLKELIFNLQTSIAAFQSNPTSTKLNEALHCDEQLPDKNISALAFNAINLLSEVQQILEPGHLILADHFLGYTSSKCLVAAVQLQIADVLSSSPKTLPELAKVCGSVGRQDRLGQILRPLYNNGIFNYEPQTQLYSNNHVSTLLRKDHWTQWHNWVDLYGNEMYDIARGIPRSIQQDSDRSSAQINFDTDQDMFTYFQSQGWVPRLHRTLGGGAAAMAPGILEDYPWIEVADSTVIDIGGGSGALIASLLRKFPTMRGGVYDLAAVISHISTFFTPEGQFADIAERVPQENLIAGDFLKWVPSAEVYVMKWVLHDWKDEEAVRILQNIHKAIMMNGGTSRLVILESILADGKMGRLSRLGDINMMMMTANGHERTEQQWRSLAAQAGWNVSGIFSLRRSWVQAIELKP